MEALENSYKPTTVRIKEERWHHHFLNHDHITLSYLRISLSHSSYPTFLASGNNDKLFLSLSRSLSFLSLYDAKPCTQTPITHTGVHIHSPLLFFQASFPFFHTGLGFPILRIPYLSFLVFSRERIIS